MNKSELISKVSESTALSKKDVTAVVNAAIEAIKNTLASGGEVDIARFGKFGVRARAARMGHNPQTGEPLQIAGKNAPYFKASKTLKDIVNA